MEIRNKFGNATTKKYERKIPSYVNDTFVPDPEMETSERNFTALTSMILEKGEGEDDEEEKENQQGLQENECINNNINESDSTFILCGDETDKFNSTEPINNNSITIYAHRTIDGNEDHSASTRNDNKDATSTSFDNKHKLEAPSELYTKRRSPPIGIKSFSFDCGNSPEIKRVTGATSPKMRSISDTRKPVISQHPGTTSQSEEDSADKRRKKYRHRNEAPALSPIHAFENIEGSDVNNIPTDEPGTSDTDKVKGNRRWRRKLARYATFDEGSVYVTKTSKITQDTIYDENVEQAYDTGEKKTTGDNCEQCTKEESGQRKISTGKLLKQSMSHRFSKFKQLSISGRSSSRKFEQNYSIIDNDDILHETSKRLESFKRTDGFQTIFNVNPAADSESTLPVSEKPFRRCLSMPDCLDSNSECDEELSDLYLPRRMAICPDLHVPAMKQLRTYLVLTRLKQYCIV